MLIQYVHHTNLYFRDKKNTQNNSWMKINRSNALNANSILLVLLILDKIFSIFSMVKIVHRSTKILAVHVLHITFDLYLGNLRISDNVTFFKPVKEPYF